MKTFRILLTAFLCIIIQSELRSQTSIGFYTGLSTPSEQINNVYNSDFLTSENFVGNLKRKATSLGYHVGTKLRFGLGDGLVFTGGVSLTRFPQSNIDIEVPNGKDTIRTTLTVTQNVIPISVGLNYYVTRKLVGMYVAGELTYNYLVSSIDGTINGINFPLDRSPTYNRVGFGLGAGMDIDLKLLALNVEAKYNLINFIGRDENEKSKSFISLSFGVYFGSMDYGSSSSSKDKDNDKK